MSYPRPWLEHYPVGVKPEVDLNEYRSIVSVLESSCERFRDRPAFTNLGTTLSYDEIDKASTQFANYLLYDLQLNKGDRVALMMPNVLQYPIAIMGVLRAGLTVVNTNPLYTARELRHQLKDSGALAIVVLDNFAHTVAEVLADTQIKQVITTGVGDLLAFPKGAIVNFVLKYVKRQVPAFGSIPKFQAVERDIAVIVAESVTHAALIQTIWAAPTQGLLRDAILFDVYRAKPNAASAGLAPGEKSLAVRLTLNSDNATLTEEQIESAVQAVLQQLTGKLGARQRA